MDTYIYIHTEIQYTWIHSYVHTVYIRNHGIGFTQYIYIYIYVVDCGGGDSSGPSICSVKKLKSLSPKNSSHPPNSLLFYFIFFFFFEFFFFFFFGCKSHDNSTTDSSGSLHFKALRSSFDRVMTSNIYFPLPAKRTAVPLPHPDPESSLVWFT